MSEWPKEAGCKPAGESLRGFESSPAHRFSREKARVTARGDDETPAQATGTGRGGHGRGKGGLSAGSPRAATGLLRRSVVVACSQPCVSRCGTLAVRPRPERSGCANIGETWEQPPGVRKPTMKGLRRARRQPAKHRLRATWLQCPHDTSVEVFDLLRAGPRGIRGLSGRLSGQLRAIKGCRSTGLDPGQRCERSPLPPMRRGALGPPRARSRRRDPGRLGDGQERERRRPCAGSAGLRTRIWRLVGATLFLGGTAPSSGSYVEVDADDDGGGHQDDDDPGCRLRTGQFFVAPGGRGTPW